MSAALADGVLAIVKAATEPLYERIKALEAVIVELQAREPVPGPMGPAGPQGEKGEPGERGERGEQGEKGERGEPGAQGIQGEKGDRGEQGERGERGEPGLVGEKGDRGEPGERGPQGEQGERGDRGPDGLKGDSGVAGRDGVGVAGALIDRDGALTLTLSDGTTKPLGVVVGAKGEPGRDGVNGRDGVGFDDLEESYEDDGRVLVRKFLKGGEVVKEFRHVTSQPVFRDVWREGVTYTKGDLVQWDGSGFIALVDAPPMKPGTGKPEVTGWKLWIKRGNQGKEGRPGPQGPQGVKGDKGDRVTERW